MASTPETRGRRGEFPYPHPNATTSPDGPADDAMWTEMLDCLDTYIRDHEALYRLLAR